MTHTVADYHSIHKKPLDVELGDMTCISIFFNFSVVFSHRLHVFALKLLKEVTKSKDSSFYKNYITIKMKLKLISFSHFI